MSGTLRQACRRFVYTENLLPEAAPEAVREGRAEPVQSASAAVHILNRAIAQMETEDGWVGLGLLGRRLANMASDFDPRTYGFRKLSDLVRGTGGFEIDQREGGAMRIRPKAGAPARTRTRAGAPSR